MHICYPYLYIHTNIYINTFNYVYKSQDQLMIFHSSVAAKSISLCMENNT